jgi:HAMP domain-containing protein
VAREENMSIRFKILSGFLILAMMLCVAGVWSIYELSAMGTSIKGLLDENYKSISAARVMTEALEREDSALLLLLSGNRREGREILKAAETSFSEGLATAKNNVTIPGESGSVQKIEDAYKRFSDLWGQPNVGTDLERNLDWYFEQVHPAFLRVKSEVEYLMILNDRTMYHTAMDLENRAHRAVMPGIVAVIASLVFSIVFSYLINHYVVSPIIRITKGIQGFLRTGQAVEVNIETDDELNRLMSSVRELLATVKQEQ